MHFKDFPLSDKIAQMYFNSTSVPWLSGCKTVVFLLRSIDFAKFRFARGFSNEYILCRDFMGHQPCVWKLFSLFVLSEFVTLGPNFQVLSRIFRTASRTLVLIWGYGKGFCHLILRFSKVWSQTGVREKSYLTISVRCIEVRTQGLLGSPGAKVSCSGIVNICQCEEGFELQANVVMN